MRRSERAFPHGTVAAANRAIMLNSLGVMLVIVIPTIAGVGLFAWWFRASNSKARYRPNFAFSGRLELLIWSIPFLVILFLGGIIWIGSHQLDPYKPLASQKKPLEVQVVSLDWKWLFLYPELQLASVNELVVPTGTPVHLSLTSGSVMNSFFVPQLGSMVAVMYGMVTQLHLMADRDGDFYGQSTQFSGQGFADMNFKVRSVSPAAFSAWTTSVRQSGGSLDLKSYQALEAPSQNVPPTTFGQVDPALFARIVSGAPDNLPAHARHSSTRGREAASIAR
ncbi:ubiquinol oxidase subunit II [Rhizobium sp. AN80A]|uniref:ubiquinol oxidase subunit II n=1 Tax=Rhizobium sp. AN80A TaxID=3040673 RepID=UPI0024B3378E|nr:ubiquinol oxidase subunit II [Rhizobium sp. AN80A]